MNVTDASNLRNRSLSTTSTEFTFNKEEFDQFIERIRSLINENRDYQNDSIDTSTASHHRQVLGLKEWNWNLINPRYKYLIKKAMFITASAIGAAAMPWKLPRIWGATVLTAVAYGIINDLFACRVCPEYFTIGHFFDGERTQNRLVKTLDPNVNALAWGMVATSTLAALGGTVLSVGASLSGADEKAVIISMVCYTALALVVADLSSRFEKARLERNPNKIYFDVPDQFQSRWHANNVRNSIGYMALIAGAIAMCIIMSKIK